MKSKSAKRDNEPLWEYCKSEAVERMGKFSARAMQYAVKLYKERGGEYVGVKSPQNSLVKWTKEYCVITEYIVLTSLRALR